MTLATFSVLPLALNQPLCFVAKPMAMEVFCVHLSARSQATSAPHFTPSIHAIILTGGPRGSPAPVTMGQGWAVLAPGSFLTDVPLSQPSSPPLHCSMLLTSFF